MSRPVRTYTAENLLTAVGVACEGAIARAAGLWLDACPYSSDGRRRAWVFGWWRGNALLSDCLDCEAAAVFLEGAA